MRKIIQSGEEAEIDCLSFTATPIPELEDQSGLAFWEKQWISDELKDILFGSTTSDVGTEAKKIRTYVIIDVRRFYENTGIYFLDQIRDVEIQCMYSGEAAENMKHVAPYLIELTLPDNLDQHSPLNFHENYFEQCWGKNVGVFIRTQAQFETVNKHFKRFLRAIDEETGKWTFFNFYDPKVVIDYFHSINTWAERCKLFFQSRDGDVSYQMLAEQESGSQILSIEANETLLKSDISVPAFAITSRDKAGLKEIAVRKNCQKMAAKLNQLFPSELEEANNLEERVFKCIQRMREYGFVCGEHLFQLAAFEVFYGEAFERQQPDGKLQKICESDLDENTKFKQFIDHITQLSVSREANE